MFENIAKIVCCKPEKITAEECFKSLGKKNPLCGEYGKCRISEKSQQQFDYVTSSIDKNIFLSACPGSGKTEAVGMKAAYEIQQWNKKPQGIAILTFTNNAADIIKKRAIQFAGSEKVKYPHFIGTFDSWLHGYIANPFAHTFTKYEGKDNDRSIRLIEEKEHDGWLDKYKIKTPFITSNNKRFSIFANNIFYNISEEAFYINAPYGNHSIKDEEYYSSASFKRFRKENDMDWLTLEKMRGGFLEAKKSFWKSGFATYSDVELISTCLLSETDFATKISQRFPFIIIDECQDLSPEQLDIIDYLIKAGSKVNFVGDLDQAIYSFKDVNPDDVKDFVDDNDFEKLSLSMNYRSIQPIVDLCSQVVGKQGIKGNFFDEDGPPACIFIGYDQNDYPNMIKNFENILEERGIPKSNSAIIARGKSQINEIKGLDGQETKTNHLLPQSMLLYKNGDLNSRKEAFEKLGKFIST
jgi:DNA helicase-2/ATP-dependent DNA helicase PcrA